MKKYFFCTIFIVFFGACNSKDKPKDSVISSYKVKIQFNFYPSSGGNAIYEVDYNDGHIKIKNNENSNDVFRIKLNKEQNAKIVEITNRIRIAPNTTTEVVLDSWRIELKINGKVYYNKSGVKIKDLPTEIGVLLDYLLRGSTVRIDLYDFS